MQTKSSCRKMVNFSYFQSQMEHPTCPDEIKFAKNFTSHVITLHEAKGIKMTSKENRDGFQPLDTIADDSDPTVCWLIAGNCIDRHHVELRVKL